MPTARPRHMLTETDDVRRALDAAADAWPELSDNRTALLRRLIEHGAHALHESAVEAMAKRMLVIREAAGSLPNVYRTGEAELLRGEWPE